MVQDEEASVIGITRQVAPGVLLALAVGGRGRATELWPTASQMPKGSSIRLGMA